MPAEPPRRRAARGLIVDGRERVLLFRGEVEGRAPWWFAPGGALEHDESYVEALVRELAEETGLVITSGQAGEPVWTREHLFEWRGRMELHVEQFFLLRVESMDVDTSGELDAEQSATHRHRWWSLDEIRQSREQFSPRSLADLLAPLLSGGYRGPAVDMSD